MERMERKEYRILQPVRSHTRPATCEEFGCKHFLNGWRTRVDISTELGQRQRDYIVNDRSRRAVAEIEGTIITFSYEPGQRCFNADSHRLPTDRPAIFVTRDRGSVLRHSGADPWVDDFATHQDRLYRAWKG